MNRFWNSPRGHMRSRRRVKSELRVFSRKLLLQVPVLSSGLPATFSPDEIIQLLSPFASEACFVFRPNGPAVYTAWPSGPGTAPPIEISGPTGRQFIPSAPANGRPVGPEILFLFRDLARWARLLERMARWAGNALESSSEFLSKKHGFQRLLGRRLL